LPRLVDAPAQPAEAPEEKEKAERSEKFTPRYVDLSSLRDRGNGPRNLVWGSITFFLAILVFSLAVFVGGPRAAMVLAICLLTFGTLFVLSRLHLFRQRNGGFLAVAIVCLLGSILALVERGFAAADTILKHPTMAVSASTIPQATIGEVPLLTQAFALKAPDAKKRQVRILKDSRVVIEERPFAIKAGDVFALLESKGEETTFAVRDLRVALPSNVVEVLEPVAEVKKASVSNDDSSATTTQETKPKSAAPASKAAVPAIAAAKDEMTQLFEIAQREAVRRYTALAVKDSRENKLFNASWRQKKNTGEDEFFANPDWPIILADELAKQEGWVRDGQTQQAVAGSNGSSALTDGPTLPTRAPVADPDTLPPDDTPSLLPKVDPVPR